MSDKTGIVFLVGAGPGDPGLITLRGLECLRRAEVVVYDRLANPALLVHAPQAERIDVGKQPQRHPIPQREINRILVEQARAGKTVVRLKGGDPFVFGRGGEEALALHEAGIPFEIVPGITSGIAAPAYAGIPVTQRGVAASVAFITGHDSESGEERDFQLDTSMCGADTLVFFMGVRNLERIISSLLAAGRSEDTPVAVIQRGTTAAQKVITGTLADIRERSVGVQSPAITVVGEVVRHREDLRWFERQQARPLLGLRVLNTRPVDGDEPDDLDRRLAELGAESIHLPAIQVLPAPDQLPLQRAIDELARRPGGAVLYDWVVFTSAHAVTFFCDYLLKQAYDVRLLYGLKIAALGQRTSDALRRYGLRADFIPASASGQTLAAEMPGIEARRILLPCSAIAPPDLQMALLQRGAFVDRVTAYTVVNAIPDADLVASLCQGGAVDAALFFSPSALKGLASMLGETSLSQALAGCVIACVGPTTASAAEQAKLYVDVVAGEASVDGVVSELVKKFEEQ